MFDLVEWAFEAVASIPEASVSAYAAVRNRAVDRVSFGATRACAIEDARDGESVRIRGRLQAAPEAGALRAPVSGEPCVAWTVKVFRRETLWREHELLHLCADAGESLSLHLVHTGGVAHLGSGFLDLAVEPVDVPGHALSEESRGALRRILEARDLDEGALEGSLVRERRLSASALVEVGGVASHRTTRRGYRDAGSALWLLPLPSGQLPVRAL